MKAVQPKTVALQSAPGIGRTQTACMSELTLSLVGRCDVLLGDVRDRHWVLSCVHDLIRAEVEKRGPFDKKSWVSCLHQLENWQELFVLFLYRKLSTRLEIEVRVMADHLCKSWRSVLYGLSVLYMSAHPKKIPKLSPHPSSLIPCLIPCVS